MAALQVSVTREAVVTPAFPAVLRDEATPIRIGVVATRVAGVPSATLGTMATDAVAEGVLVRPILELA